jgi:hypothetical protein
MNYLKKLGCSFVIRSAKSGGPVDVVGIFRGHILFIQVKSGRACRVTPEEIGCLRALADMRPNDHVEVWFWKNRARRPQIEHIRPIGCIYPWWLIVDRPESKREIERQEKIRKMLAEVPVGGINVGSKSDDL